MKIPVPRQSSTKWWILLAAVIAAVLTYFDQRRTPAPTPRPEPVQDSDFVEIEVVGD